MDTRDINKGLAAILVSGIAFLTTGLVGDLLVRPRTLKEPAIKIEPPAPPPPPAAKQEAQPSLPALLAKANPTAGAMFGKLACGICHTFDEGGKAGVGPNLYDVVGGPRAHMQGFAYSDGLKAKGGEWTYEALDAWLAKPADVVPGTKMAFGGISKPEQRADVIVWLRSLSHDPKPLPEVKEAAAPADAGGLPPIAPLLATADAKAGETYAKTICTICHTVNEGGRAVVGPNLYNVVGGPKAHMTGFAYSEGMKSKGGTWTYEDLNHWLAKPSEYVPGNKMAFAGIPDAKQRANVIAWLRSLSANPQPLP
ncbi:Cytochrome c family protein [Rhodovastum atsumiense]|nr:cytochrome c family protein [Rhodovastum atsumiense]CAH2601003.1 Cytochrome c family protein [Rhodovastum atsumiense]